MIVLDAFSQKFEFIELRGTRRGDDGGVFFKYAFGQITGGFGRIFPFNELCIREFAADVSFALGDGLRVGGNFFDLFFGDAGFDHEALVDFEPEFAGVFKKMVPHGFKRRLHKTAARVHHGKNADVGLPAVESLEHAFHVDGKNDFRFDAVALGVQQAGFFAERSGVAGDGDAELLPDGSSTGWSP